MLGSTCDAFCTAYPLLCKDPSDVTLRGNFAAPNGDYYTQVRGDGTQSPSAIGTLVVNHLAYQNLSSGSFGPL